MKADIENISIYQVIVSTTDFKKDTYGEAFFNDYKQRLLKLGTSTDVDEITVMRSVIMDPWISENLEGTPFVDTVIQELRNVVLEVLQEMKGTPVSQADKSRKPPRKLGE